MTQNKPSNLRIRTFEHRDTDDVILVWENCGLIRSWNNPKLDIERKIFFQKDDQDTRIKHIYLNEKGKKIFNEIFNLQKKRIYNALINSSSEEVINFDNVLKKIING